MLKRTGTKPNADGGKTSVTAPARHSGRDLRRERRLWHDPQRKTDSLGCRVCPDRALCGGIRPETAFFDCLQFCCGAPDKCDRVCRNHPEFPDRVREVGTFALDTVPRGPVLPAPALPPVVPVIYHCNGRTLPIASDVVALPLYRMFDRRDGTPRFTAPEALREAFGVRTGTTIVLTGTDRDRPLERWWGLGEIQRREIIRAMKAAGIGLVTTPNYSLFIDRPRWDDLHAMKRIALVHAEFLREGLPAALHVNGRTETDFSRWAAYIAARPEIRHIAYEFTTGTGRSGRRGQHVAWLVDLAAAIDRPLHLVVRGGTDVLPLLARSFSGITVLETSSFMKTMMRQRAYPKGNAALGWKRAPTATGAPLDDLFADNRATMEAWLRDLAATSAERARPTG